MHLVNCVRAFGLGTLLLCVLAPLAAGAQGPKTLPDPSGRVIELDAAGWTAHKRTLPGMPSLVVIWYDGCEPVKLVPRFLDRLRRSTGTDFTVTFVSIDDVEKVPAAATRLGLPIPWFTAPAGEVTGDSSQELFRGVTSAPGFVFFDEAGRRQTVLNGIESFGDWTLRTEYVRNGRPIGGTLDFRGEQLAAALVDQHIAARTPTERLIKAFRLEATLLRSRGTTEDGNGIPLNKVAGTLENAMLGLRIPVTVTGWADPDTSRVGVRTLTAAGVATPLRRLP